MARNPFTRTLFAGGLALALIATACGDDLSDQTGNVGNSTNQSGTETVTINGDEIVLTSGLSTFDDCDNLLTHLRTEGVERVGPWGFNSGGYYGPFDGDIAMEDDLMEEAEMVTDSADAAGDAVELTAGGDDSGFRNAAAVPSTTSLQGGEQGKIEGEDFSGTNNQELGVDEPDFVKTDGDRIYTMTSGRFRIVDANDGNPVARGSVNTNHETQEMLIVGEKVYLFGMSWGEPEYFEDEIAIDDAEAEFADADIAVIGRGGYYGPQVKIVELDIRDLDNPEVVNELYVDGFYLSSRLIDGKISVALQSEQHDLGFVFPQGQKGEEQAEEFNKQIVMETEISDWLPSYRLTGAAGEASGQLSGCSNVHAPAEFAGFGSLSVLTFAGTEGLTEPNAASVLASGQNVYASTDAMWISTNQWFDWGIMSDAARRDAENSFTTQIHGFSIAGDTPTYRASGSVRGHLLNQFSMSEYEGVLRVASTDGTAWGNDGTSESFVTTFAVDETELRQLGQVGDMGKGEQIFAVRFVGDVGYVVTFRQTDPFYTVDLSDPANPVVLGELKITGFSGQLHPLGPNHVLGIGQEATEEGRTTGAKVTLFDVSDLSNPTDIVNWTVDNSWSNAQWDHKAFLWWPQENLAVLPVQNWEEQFFGAVAFRIDVEAGTLEEAGRLDHIPDGDQAIGVTDCAVVDPADLEQYRDSDRGELAELSWIAEDMSLSGGQIQVCSPDDKGGATGLFCERWDWIDTDEIGIDGDFEFCWPEYGPDPINRTLVIGDTLWSLSDSRLQANEISTFEPGNYVEFEGARY